MGGAGDEDLRSSWGSFPFPCIVGFPFASFFPFFSVSDADEAKEEDEKEENAFSRAASRLCLA